MGDMERKRRNAGGGVYMEFIMCLVSARVRLVRVTPLQRQSVSLFPFIRQPALSLTRGLLITLDPLIQSHPVERGPAAAVVIVSVEM